MKAIKVLTARFGLAVRIEINNHEEYFVSCLNDGQKHFKMYLVNQQVFVFNEKTKKTFVIPVTNVRELQIDANTIPGEYIDSFVEAGNAIKQQSSGERDTKGSSKTKN